MAASRIYLNVPFKEKDTLKKLGAKWDDKNRGWWIDPGVDRTPYTKWLPRMHRPEAKAPHIVSDLVPQNTWFVNLRSLLPKEEWDLIRKEVYETAGHRCQVCGGKGPKWPVECNEQWQYILDSGDSKRGVQKLLRLSALCPLCHSIKHAGLANMRGTINETISQLSYVNGWTQQQSADHIDQAMEVFTVREGVEWTFDLSVLSNHGVHSLTVDLAADKLPVIMGLSLKYRGFAYVFNRIASTYDRALTKIIASILPGLVWKKLRGDCPIWYAQTKRVTGGSIIIIVCTSKQLFTDGDIDLLKTFIQDATTSGIFVVNLIRPDDLTDNFDAVSDSTSALHPYYFLAKFHRDSFDSISWDGDVWKFKSFLKSIPRSLKLKGWENPSIECGLEFLKDTCGHCKKSIFRFTGILLPSESIRDIKDGPWNYHTYIAHEDASNYLLQQVIPVVNGQIMFDSVETTKAVKRPNGISLSCPHCEKSVAARFYGGIDDYDLWCAKEDEPKSRRGRRLRYAVTELNIDHLSTHNVDGAYGGSVLCHIDDRPRWIIGDFES